MNISPNEAEEALAAIQKVTQKTRRSVASSGAYIFLIITGLVWLVGFLATQFLTGDIVGYIWTGMTILGTALSIPLGARISRRVHNPSVGAIARRAVLFWVFLILCGIATIAVTRPTDGKQATMIIILFIMIGQMAMGMLTSFSSVWWTLPVVILALIGYFLLPGYFYLWMAILGGGGMIALAFYYRSRW